jgi:hypothetical protein
VALGTPNKNDFWSCDPCPIGDLLTDTVSTTACYFGTKYQCHK